MKTSHSKLWEKKRNSLGLKETRLANELEDVSGNFETKARNIIIGVVVAGVTIYAISKMVGGSGKEEKKKKGKSGKQEASAQKVVQKRSFSFKNILFEKVTIAVVGLIISQLGKMVTPSKSEDESKDS